MGSSNGTVLGKTTLHSSGPEADRWNLVIMGDGYTRRELPDFHRHAQWVADFFLFGRGLEAAPFRRMLHTMNLHRIDVISDESGVSDDTVKRKTYFEASFPGSYPVVWGIGTLAQSVAEIHVKGTVVVLVLINTTRPGGGGPLKVAWSTAGQPDMTNYALHELGHSGFGLADEYIDTVLAAARYGGGEPSAPNLTTSTGRTTAKWWRLIEPTTPLPTWKNPDPKCQTEPSPPVAAYPSPTLVGLFEGASSAYCGIYRPVNQCKMRVVSSPFCPVCRQHIALTLAKFGGGMPWDLFGNAQTDPAIEYLGTSDKTPLSLKTNGVTRVRIDELGHVNVSQGMTIGAGISATLQTRHVDGKDYQSDKPGGLYLNFDNLQPVAIGQSKAPADLSVSGGAIVGAGGNATLKVRHIDGKDGASDNAGGLHLNWSNSQPVWIGNVAAPAGLQVSGSAVIGAGGGNASLKTRHIDGKDGASDNAGGLHLNWSNSQPVWIGSATAPASLQVSGDTIVGAGRDATLFTRHISGKHHQTNNPDALFLNAASGQPVVVGQPGRAAEFRVFGNSTASLSTSSSWPMRADNTMSNSGGWGAILGVCHADTSAVAGVNQGNSGGVAGITLNGGARNFGVLGTAGLNPAPLFQANTTGGIGAVGIGGAGGTVGVSFGLGASANHGVEGSLEHASVAGSGVHGKTGSTNGVAIFGQHLANGMAGRFLGQVEATGTISGAEKRFRIDHPLDPKGKFLNHASVESAEALVCYSGNVVTDKNGDAVVQLPGYVSALAHDFRYQLTVIGQFAQAIVAREIEDGAFLIKTDKGDVKVSWQVTGMRRDAYATAHPMIVEEEKSLQDRGRFLHPELYGEHDARPIGWLPAAAGISAGSFTIQGVQTGAPG